MLLSSQAERLFGYEPYELAGVRVEEVLSTAAGGELWYREPTTGRELDLTARRKDGTEFAVEISLSETETMDGRLTLAAVREVTESELAAESLAHQASHDPLTGLTQPVAVPRPVGARAGAHAPVAWPDRRDVPRSRRLQDGERHARA